ncbi:MAG: hypothetical protein R2877_04585 [Bdellovibrionota bacterium]
MPCLLPGGQSRIFDPYNGQNQISAAQYMAAPTQGRILPEATRGQRYSLNYTQAQADACLASYQETQTLNQFCTQVMYDIYYRFYGPGFQNWLPGNSTQITAGNNTFDFGWRSLFNPSANSDGCHNTINM